MNTMVVSFPLRTASSRCASACARKRAARHSPDTVTQNPSNNGSYRTISNNGENAVQLIWTTNAWGNIPSKTPYNIEIFDDDKSIFSTTRCASACARKRAARVTGLLARP
jgi:hypothetical protein